MTALLAALMALNSFAIDAMIPALPQIGQSLNVARENDRQLVVIAYFVGFAATQLVWGPLADRFGRKPIMAAGVGLYGIFALLCAFAQTFPLLIAGRILMGASAAASRVLVVAMVRDLFEAEAMAKVMSLVFMTFMLVPVLAPNVGQLILLVASWRAIFVGFRSLRRRHDHLVVGPASGDLASGVQAATRMAGDGDRNRKHSPRASVARLHDCGNGQLFGTDCLYFLDPADRLRRLS